MNLVYGKNTIESIILNDCDQIKKLYIQKGSSFGPEAFQIIKTKNILWESVEKQDLNRLFKDKIPHQGFVAEVKPFIYAQLKDVISKSPEKQTLLMLDRIQDPHNFGSIIRTAVMLGVNGIIIQEHNQVGVTPAVFKVSAGTIYQVPIVMVSNLTNAINELKSNGYWIYATTLEEDAQLVNNVDFDKKSVIIVGNEGDGVMNKLINNSDIKVKINTKQTIDSLNVSVATGILLYKIYNS